MSPPQVLTLAGRTTRTGWSASPPPASRWRMLNWCGVWPRGVRRLWSDSPWEPGLFLTPTPSTPWLRLKAGSTPTRLKSPHFSSEPHKVAGTADFFFSVETDGGALVIFSSLTCSSYFVVLKLLFWVTLKQRRVNLLTGGPQWAEIEMK